MDFFQQYIQAKSQHFQVKQMATIQTAFPKSNFQKNAIGLAMSISISCLSVSALAEPTLGEDSIDKVVAALTLEEKIKLVRGTGMSTTDNDEGPAVGENDKGKVTGAAGTTHAVPRLGIPSIVLADGPAGLRIQPHRTSDPDNTFYCTAFPIATLLASSWDTALVESVGKSIGEEVKEYGVDILLAPGMNVQRYPLGGRNFEYYSEDPLLSGKMAAAMVRGVQSQGVGASLKHYVANNHEWNRDTLNVKIDEKTLQEIYLKGFEIAVKDSQPWTVMSSYNKVNGEYTSESHTLLTTVLRGQWGFEGFVMTDWFGGQNAEQQIEAGNDLLMPGTDQQEQALLAAAKHGRLDIGALDTSVKRLLNIIVQTPTFKSYEYSNKPDLEHNANIARRAAAEGMVLLKNDKQTLPLPTGAGLALFGNTSYKVVTGGTGSGDVNEAYSVSLMEGLANQNFVVDQSLSKSYQTYIDGEVAKQPKLTGLEAFLPVKPFAELSLSQSSIEAAAENNDLAVVTLGRSSGEFVDREAADFSMREAEVNVLKMVSKAFHKHAKPVVVIMNIGGSVEMVSWRDHADAILLAWQPGQEAGNAIADLLIGKVTPSGKLTNTFPVSLDQYVASQNFPGKVTDPDGEPAGILRSLPSEVTYHDTTEVGYRYFNAHDSDVAYPFGYGLSYTNFKYSDIKVGKADKNGNFKLTLTVKNTGQYAGKEVVQLYVSRRGKKSYPYGTDLHDFVKTGQLQPGASQTVSLQVTSENLQRFNADKNRWRLEKGKYDLFIGSSSRNIAYKSHFNPAHSLRIEE